MSNVFEIFQEYIIMNTNNSIKKVILFLGCLSVTVPSSPLLANNNLENPQKYQNNQDHEKHDKVINLKPYLDAVENRERENSILWGQSSNDDYNSYYSYFRISLYLPIPDDFPYKKIFEDEFFSIWNDHFVNTLKNMEHFLSSYTDYIPTTNTWSRAWTLRGYDHIKGRYYIRIRLPNEAWVIFDKNFDQFKDNLLDYYSEILRKTKYVIERIYVADKREIHDVRKTMWALWNEAGHQNTAFGSSSQDNSKLNFYAHKTWKDSSTLWENTKWETNSKTTTEYTMTYDSRKPTMCQMEKFRKAWEQYHLEFFEKNRKFIDQLEKEAGLDEERKITSIEWTTKWKYGSTNYEIRVPVKVLTHMGEKFTPYYKDIQKELTDFYKNSALEIEQ